jgi:hypothetical protein
MGGRTEMKFARAALISPKELADSLGLSIATLADWRSQRRGPTYLSVGRKIWYPKDRVDMWLEANLRETSNDDITKAEREMALSLQARRSGIQRNDRLGRHRTKRDPSEAA